MSDNDLRVCARCDRFKPVEDFHHAANLCKWCELVKEAESPDPGQHYRHQYKGIKLDPFRIAKVYGITDFGQQTILKKALRMGSAHKGRQQDLKDIICAAERMIEMLNEDESNA